MAHAATPRRIRIRRAAAPVLPEELVAWEILVRLPAKALLRCRAVSRSWRRLTSDPGFLRAHHRRQPSLPLVSFHGEANGDVVDAALDAFDLGRSPAERRPVLRFNDYNYRRRYQVWASRDGLLLLSLSNGRFYICNPATRQWISLPNLSGGYVFGLYPHSSSGEYRILYRKNRRRVDSNTVCYVLTAGSSMEPRVIVEYIANGLSSASHRPPVLLHGCLHWLRHTGGEMLAFDTVAESFRWMRAPNNDNWVQHHLLEMGDALGISCINEMRTMMKLWMLQDYETEVWLLKYQIEIPVVEMSSVASFSGFNGMVLSKNGDVLVYCLGNWHMFHIDNKGKLLQKFQWDRVFSRPTGHWFKESLVSHGFLQRQSGGRVKQPRFFRGL